MKEKSIIEEIQKPKNNPPPVLLKHELRVYDKDNYKSRHVKIDKMKIEMVDPESLYKLISRT